MIRIIRPQTKLNQGTDELCQQPTRPRGERPGMDFPSEHPEGTNSDSSSPQTTDWLLNREGDISAALCDPIVVRPSSGKNREGTKSDTRQ